MADRDEPRTPGSKPKTPTPPRPDRTPRPGPDGPRTPYPVNDPGVADPRGPGSEPDLFPGRPLDPGTRI
ncbi:MAG TPA: hypothetical protein VHD15_02595 [Hyphomicrobiales bacterium]|nr:hypothetical protein [Hyphomicrobiales bacterium]